uniref:Cna B-type protein n=1 Tax=mine drainage metagenome TaxID=410659 RepID=E6QM93_9ZZZZ
MLALAATTLAFAGQAPSNGAKNIPAEHTGGIALHGQITDPTGALIPGAKVSANDASGKAVATATSDASGNYEIHSLAPGSYVVMAISEGFSPSVSQPIAIAAGQSKRVDISMAIQQEEQNVVVTDDTPTVSTDAAGNANSMIITGKDIDALSDDPNELQSELSALAGPSAGPNGGQIFIDGFSGGQLPPKSSIREIRVNQNPFSAEFDKLGYGRIEILTKPGTDKLHGQFFIQGNDGSFNTADPLITTPIPAYYSYQYNGTVSGSINKNASFFVSAEHRNINNLNAYDAPCSATGDCSVGISGTIPNPKTRTNISPRIDLQFGPKNTLTMRYQFYRNNNQGNLAATQLPTLAFSAITTFNQIQLSDTEIINDHFVNETRFEYSRSLTTQTPVSTAPTLIIQQGGFSTGGSALQSNHDHSDQLELQNISTLSLGRHAVKFGLRLRDFRDANFSNAGYNGSFFFSQNSDFTTAVQTPAAAAPIQLTYAHGIQNALANVFDGALWVQDDWKFSDKLTISAGLRWESQNHVQDHSDWAPRFAMAWAVDGKNGKPAKTVLRAGYGLFYDGFTIGSLLNINRSLLQQQYTVLNNSATSRAALANCFAQSQTQFNTTACNIGQADTRTIDQVAPNYRSPYAQQIGASIERQLNKFQTGTVTYLHTIGDHQLVEINANAPYFPTYNPAAGNIYQYLPEGVFKENQFIFNTHAQFNPRFGFFGFYTLSFANTDGAASSNVTTQTISPVSNSLNISQDYGRANFVSRNSVFVMGNYLGPWGIRFNPFLLAKSGLPFNITLPNDPYGDTFLIHRPGVAAAASCTADSTRYKQTSYGCLDTEPTLSPSEKLLTNNAGNGPAAVAVNLRISRQFAVGPKVSGGGANFGGGGGPHHGGGGPGGGFGPGGFAGPGGPGGPFGGPSVTRKYNLNFSVQALNMFNNHDYGTPNGTVIAPGNLGSSPDIFGHSQSMAPGLFSNGSAVRRIFMQAIFTF